MKHVKLFEEFTEKAIKYELVKPLPVSDIIRNFINTDNADELIAIKGELEKLGLDNRGNLSVDMARDYIRIRDFFKDAHTIIWTDKAFYSNNREYGDDSSSLKFEDYFKPKPEYRGINLKRFGV